MTSKHRDGIDYEFTVLLDLTHDMHTATASKDRTNRSARPSAWPPAGP